MSFSKTVAISVFLHLSLFTAVLLLSANLSGGSSKISTNKVIFVDLIRDQSGAKNPGSVVRHNKGQRDKQSLHINSMKDTSIKNTGQHRNIQSVDLRENNKTIVKQISHAKSTKDTLNDPDIDIQEHHVSPNPSSISDDTEGNFSAEKDVSMFADHKKGDNSDNNNRLFIEIREIIRRYIERAKTYPLLARKRGIEGTVYVKFRINPDGQPAEIQIVRSSGSEILDKGALKIIKNAGPFPYVNDALEIPISFRLEE